MAAHANWRQAEVAKGYARKARECDAAVPGDDTPFTDKLKSYGTEGRVLGPTVGCWCETSSDFDLLVELIAHVLADKETSVVCAWRTTRRWPGNARSSLLTSGSPCTSPGRATYSTFASLSLAAAPSRALSLVLSN